MNLVITREQADELHGLLVLGLRDLSHEIAATDNAEYRAGLFERRQRLTEVSAVLGRLLAVPETATDTGEALERDRARPGA